MRYLENRCFYRTKCHMGRGWGYVIHLFFNVRLSAVGRGAGMARKQVPEALGHEKQAVCVSGQAMNPEPWLLRKFWRCRTDHSKSWGRQRVLREGGEAGESG